MKSVVVTGASTGIGWGCVKILIAGGLRVFGSVRKAADAERLRKEFGANFTPLIFDVTDAAAVAAGAQHVDTALAGETLFGLVNNAGIAVPGPLLLVPIEDFKHQIEVNLIGQLIVTQAFAPLLGTDRGRTGAPGRIVMISSVGGKNAMPFLGPYSASKFALEGLSESLRRELMLFGVDVIVVAPGAIATPIWEKADTVDIAPLADTPYAPALETPPLLVVCDLARFEIHTNWTNTVSQTYEIELDELVDPRKLRWLKWTFSDPERLKPGLTRQTLTEEAAAEFARLAQRLRDRGHPSQTVAHFINRLVFCMFAALFARRRDMSHHVDLGRNRIAAPDDDQIRFGHLATVRCSAVASRSSSASRGGASAAPTIEVRRALLSSRSVVPSSSVVVHRWRKGLANRAAWASDSRSGRSMNQMSRGRPVTSSPFQ